MFQVQSLPTIFAISIAEEVGLPTSGEDDFGERLRHFQQMAITCSFEEALIAYHGIEYDDDQKAALETIYNSTKPWLLGHVTGTLMKKLAEDRLTTDAARLIVSLIKENGEPLSEEFQSKLIVKLAGPR